jgi:hypothetical protein
MIKKRSTVSSCALKERGGKRRSERRRETKRRNMRLSNVEGFLTSRENLSYEGGVGDSSLTERLKEFGSFFGAKREEEPA